MRIGQTTELNRDMARAVEEAILRRTFGQVHNLRVQTVKQEQPGSPSIEVSGQTGTYYGKQLVLAALMEEFPEQTFDTRIDVRSSRPRRLY